jgi:predicted TIM-barrel fold metal-dependent hydrolase
MNVIDFHTHTFPDAIAAKAIAGMQANSHAAAFGSGTVDGLLESMERSGICRSVVLPVATNPQKIRSINDANILREKCQHVVYFGAMHPLAENWKDELDRLHAAGVPGIKIHPQYQGVDITDIRYLRILDYAAGLGFLTVMHAGDEIAYPGVVRCSPEMVRSVCDQLGNIPLVLAHMGGWKNWERVAENLCDTGCYLDTAISLGEIAALPDGHYAPGDLPLLSGEDFVSLVRAFGSERILFGTDSPWADQAQEVRKISSLPLTQTEIQNILSRNAARLLPSP